MPKQLLESLKVPNSDDRIVLYDYPPGGGTSANLHRVSPAGETVWTADLPDYGGADAYVTVSFQSDALIANSFSCFQVVLDVETGRIRESVFTK